MAIHSFTVVLDRRPTGEDLDTLFDYGMDSATFGVDRGVPIAEFDIEAETMADALVAAIRGLESAGIAALRVIDEDLVTLADIADRIEQSRESVRRYVTGERGSGGFPPPLNPGREGTIFYRWSEVAPWVRTNLGIDVPDADPALIVANLVLQARQFRGRVEHLTALTDLLAA
jgi:hypothetical protein